MVEIKELKKINLKKPVLIDGFPGVGMIGTAAVMYLIKELNMELCGYIHSDKFPPFCTIRKGMPLPPARIYQSQKNNLLVIISEFAVPLNMAYDVCCEILRWSKEKRVKRIYSLGGINIKVKEEDIDKVFGVGTTEGIIKDLKKHDIITINEGVTTGVTGAILAKAYVDKFPVVSLLTPSRKIGVDLRSAGAVLNKLGEIEKIKISTEKLVKEGKVIEKKLNELMGRIKEMKQKYKKLEEPGPGPMYR